MSKIDATVAVVAVKKMGSKKRRLCEIAAPLDACCKERKVVALASHIPGVLNVKADWNSRRVLGEKEWILNRQTFNMLNHKWGPCGLGAFAAAWNYQTYRCLMMDPSGQRAVAVDFMTHSNMCSIPNDRPFGHSRHR